jgi:outer membrane protein assembly factor BamB
MLLKHITFWITLVTLPMATAFSIPDFNFQARPTYAGSAKRLFFNGSERQIDKNNVSQLTVKWQFQTGAIVTASPVIYPIKVNKSKPVSIVFVQSWDNTLYALRLSNGTEVWRFKTEVQPGAGFPNVGSVHIDLVDGKQRLFFGAGETMYALEPSTGKQIWKFYAGTGCSEKSKLCGFGKERNQIESSPIVANGKVIFGMDVNDLEGGKGGVYALDARDGRLQWFFDVDTGQTCRAFPRDEIRAFDGYHTEQQLGLPQGFLASRPGCDFARTPTGCGNVWSSPAVDFKRRFIFLASSNCDVDEDPETLKPSPPSSPFNEAIFALDFDGTPVWRWRPRETCEGGGFECFNADLAFGAVPNLFRIQVNGRLRDVVGVGNKDGTYYVIDRDGINHSSGVRWDDLDARQLPYWRRNVVSGGVAGGILATAAVDERSRRIYFSTAPGGINDTFNPQTPTIHALNMDTGNVSWQNFTEKPDDASFSPVSAIPGVAFTGSILQGVLRAYDTDTGLLLARIPIAEPVSIPGFPQQIPTPIVSGAVIYNGIVIVGAGTGQRSENPADLFNISSFLPQKITALCVPGTPACHKSNE